ncbi:MAG: hypothetical protein AAF519_02105 [Bacteroidota bacterium]
MRQSYILKQLLFFLALYPSCKTANFEGNSGEIDIRLSEYFGDNNFKKIWNTSKTYVIGMEQPAVKERIPGLSKPLQFVVFKLNDNDWSYERTLSDGTVSWQDEFTIKIYDYQSRIERPEISDGYMLFDVRTKKLSQPTEHRK